MNALQRDAVVADYISGMLIKQIVAKYNISVHTLYYQLKQAGVIAKRSETRLNRAIKVGAVADYLIGVSINEISFKWNVSHPTLYAWLHEVSDHFKIDRHRAVKRAKLETHESASA